MTYKINLVVSEILETEQSYVNHLKEIVVVRFINFNMFCIYSL